LIKDERTDSINLRRKRVTHRGKRVTYSEKGMTLSNHRKILKPEHKQRKIEKMIWGWRRIYHGQQEGSKEDLTTQARQEASPTRAAATATPQRATAVNPRVISSPSAEDDDEDDKE
jgi:hypothetical protein